MKSSNHQCKKCCGLKAECKISLDHLSRVEGQLKTLRRYIEERRSCEEIAMLSTSVAKSFDALRMKTLKNFFKNEILEDKKLSKDTESKIETMLKLYKK